MHHDHRTILRRPFTPTVLAAVAALAAAMPAAAWRTKTDSGTEIDFASTISYGLQVRTKDPRADNVGIDNGGGVPTTGAVGDSVGGAANPDFNYLNGDDGNLNYKSGDVVSAALKGTHELGLKSTDGWRFLARGTWVYDTKVDDTRRTALSSEAKEIAARNFTMLDFWLSKDLNFGDGKKATVRLGNQVLSWGEDIFIIGGINQINAFDLRKLHTPGTQVKEILRPAPMLSLNTAVAQGVSLEAYYQFVWNAFRFDPVGTFFSTADIVGAGQRNAYIPTSLGLCSTTCGDNGSAIRYGENVVPFEPDRKPPKGKQYGVSMRFNPDWTEAEFAFYYERYHDKLPFTTLFTQGGYPGNALGLGYYNEYGTDKNLYGASFNTKVGPVALGGELSYRPRDSVAIDGSVMGSGRYSIFDSAYADPSGRITVRGFTEERKLQAHLTGLYFVEVNSWMGSVMKALGAAEATLLGEVAVTRYPNLRIGEVPYYIFPSYENPTKSSWGYAAEMDLSYPRVLGTDWNLTQVTVFTHDVNGISPNTLPFVKGRRSLYLGLNFDQSAIWRVQAGYAKYFGGGLTNMLRDRDNLSVNVSYNF